MKRFPLLRLMLRLATSTALVCAASMLLALAFGAASPGVQVAYVSVAMGGYGDIFLLDIDHNITLNLTRSRANDLSPDWSSDGTRLAFSSDRNENAYAIYILNLQDGELQQFTATIGYNAFAPEWSPDDRQIMVRLVPQEGGASDVCAIEVSGAEVNCISDITNPAWSPDGQRLAFYQYDTAAGTVLHFIDSDGGNDRIMTGDLGSITGLKPAWSADGQQIAFSLRGDIYVMDSACASPCDSPRLLVNYGGDEYNVTWSNDGRFVVFQSDRDGSHDLYVMELATQHIRRLTDNDIVDHSPAWRP